jgi:hypothetical protein
VLTEIGPVQAQTPTPAGRDRRDRAVAHRSRSGRRVRWPHFEEVYGAKVSRDVVIDMLTGGPVDLLPDRESATLAAWLLGRGGTRVVGEEADLCARQPGK